MKHVQSGHNLHPYSQGAEYANTPNDSLFRKLEMVEEEAEHGLTRAKSED